MQQRSIKLNNRPLIWPIPNECSWNDGCFDISEGLPISCDSKFAEEAEIFILQLADAGTDAWISEAGVSVKIAMTEDSRINGEGYVLVVDPDQITLQAKTKQGAFYGMQSLIQLIRNSPDGMIPAVSIVDSPFKAVRGMHMYVPPRNKLAWFKRFIDFLARYRYNTIYMETGAAVKFDSHPEINLAWEGFCREMLTYPGGPDGYGMQMSVGHFKDSVHMENGGGSCLEKAEIRDLLDYIEKRHIKVIPEVQSLSHSYWLLLSHREYAERGDDPYPDTYCPSNPGVYDIYFDCLEEIVDLFRPDTVHIGHDEYYTIGMCGKCKGKTGHDILAEDIIRIHNWLALRGIKTTVWGDKLFEYVLTKENGAACGGRERLNFNRQTGRNELMKATYRAVDMIPNDIIIMDWYHSLGGEDTGSEDYFRRRGFDVVFGNFDDIRWHRYGIRNIEDRLRKPNVLGAECSLWQEVSDLGLAMKDALVYLLDASNILWSEGYRSEMRYEYNRIIAQLYPCERDIINDSPSCLLTGSGYKFIDISRLCNMPLSCMADYSFIKTSPEIPGTIPFDISKNVGDYSTGDSCLLVGHGRPCKVEGININENLRAIAFIHAYTTDLGGPPRRPCTYVGLEEDIVGYYRINYEDGLTELIPIEYSRTITEACREFGAYWADPVYQTAEVKEIIKDGVVSGFTSIEAFPKVIFSFEWKNPYPDRMIKSIDIEHNGNQKGGIILFGITGIL